MKNEDRAARGGSQRAVEQGDLPHRNSGDSSAPVKTRTVTEYRLIITRAGGQVKDWRARSLKAIANRIGLITHAEPWRFYADEYARAKGPDDYVCCAGTRYDECGCGGITMREDTDAKRRDLPPIESIRMETRRIAYTKWEAAEAPVLVAMIPCKMCGEDHSTPSDCEFYEVADAESQRVEDFAVDPVAEVQD